MLGTELGSYRLEAELGRGATGTVYRARQLSLDRPVAVKVLHPALSADADYVARFQREATAIAQLNHENLVQVFSIGEHEGALYYAMEFIAGETLKGRLERVGRLAPQVAVRILAQACRGVGAAHAAGIVHRDLKPENIAITKAGRVKVMDFGTAHHAAAGTRVTHAGSIIGTPAFMSPEQAAGRPVTAASDVYSLGVVFYEMLTGALPFQHRDVLMLLQMHQWEEPVAPRAYVHTIPVGIEEIVLKMLAKAAAERYDSCAAVLADLRWVAKGQAERSSAHGTRSTGAVGMDLAGAPAPASAHVSDAADPYTALAECAERVLRENARRERVALHLRNGGTLRGSGGRFVRGFALLEVPEVGEVGVPLTHLAAEPLTYGTDDPALVPRSRQWAERFYAHWTASHTVAPLTDWRAAMIAAAERALPGPPDVPHRAELAALAACWAAWSAVRAPDEPAHTTTPGGTVVLPQGETEFPDRVVMKTGKVVACRVQEERASSVWILRDDGQRVRVPRNGVQCLLKNVPGDDAAPAEGGAFPDAVTLRSGRVIPCAILDRRRDALRIRKPDGRETRLTFQELAAVEWGGPPAASAGAQEAESGEDAAAHTLEEARAAYEAALALLVEVAAPTHEA